MAKRETWRSIPTFEGYQVSDLGRVRSVDRVMYLYNRWGKLAPRFYHGRLLKLGRHPKNGYLRVMLGLYAWAEVHKLVMLAFVGEPTPGLEVCHYDGNPANNRLTNLRYDTRKANMADMIRHGRQRKSKRGSFADN